VWCSIIFLLSVSYCNIFIIIYTCISLRKMKSVSVQTALLEMLPSWELIHSNHLWHHIYSFDQLFWLSCCLVETKSLHFTLFLSSVRNCDQFSVTQRAPFFMNWTLFGMYIYRVWILFGKYWSTFWHGSLSCKMRFIAVWVTYGLCILSAVEEE